MENAADIRRENLNRIRRILWAGGGHTKQTLARETGLSVATCNTLLNELAQSGEVIGEQKRLSSVGRSSAVYHANEERGLILCVHCDLIEQRQMLSWCVMTVTGRVLAQSLMQPQPTITASIILQCVQSCMTSYPAITQIMLGVPGIAEGGVVRQCDLPQLNDVTLAALAEEACRLPVHMENDMHYRIYGYARRHATDSDVLTLCYWTLGTWPGTATFHKGALITGHNLFAGFAAFLPYPISRERQLAMLAGRQTAQPLIDLAIACQISLLNPGVMVLSGEMFSEDSIPHLQSACRASIPEAYLPRFVYVPDTEPEYLNGMYHRALDLRCQFHIHNQQEGFET